MKLKDICSLNAGLVISRKKYSEKDRLHRVKKISYKLLNLNAVDDLGIIDQSKLEVFHSNELLDEQYLTSQGDILVRLNYPYTSTMITEENVGLVIPSYFIILRLENTRFTSEYVAWYLNTDRIKKELMKNQSGTLIPSINQKNLGDLDIEERSREDQENISHLFQLVIRERQLIKKLAEEKENYYRGITESILNKEED